MASETKHTKGPWDADIEDVSETFKHRAVIGPNGELVADCDGHRMSGEETAANTLLIAAAPDLLTILQSILVHGELACVDAGGHSWGSSGKKPPSKDVFQFPRHMLTDIEAAIAKASV